MVERRWLLLVEECGSKTLIFCMFWWFFLYCFVRFRKKLKILKPGVDRVGVMVPHIFGAARRGGGPIVNIAHGGPMPTAKVGAAEGPDQSL